MVIYKNAFFSIYFGGASDGLMPAYYLNLPSAPLLGISPFDQLKEKLALKGLIFLHQTHSDLGLKVDKASMARISPFKVEGDFLITDLKQVGLGIMTADCLPIVLFDSHTKTAAIVHAGWKGSLLGVAVKALERMQEEYGTKVCHVSAFFGPSAGVCCYEVSEDFPKNLEGFTQADKDQVLIKRNNKIFFDLPLFNQLQLEASGIKSSAISTHYNKCTVCDVSFCSVRREGENAGRQMTVICLN